MNNLSKKHVEFINALIEHTDSGNVVWELNYEYSYTTSKDDLLINISLTRGFPFDFYTFEFKNLSTLKGVEVVVNEDDSDEFELLKRLYNSASISESNINSDMDSFLKKIAPF